MKRRPARDLYHAALEVQVPEGRFAIEMTPIPDDEGSARGVVAQGLVGVRIAGRLRIFRYELRRWRNGVIPDIAEAVESPQRLTSEVAVARRLLDVMPLVPTPVWGRDALKTGEMWNSNSVISWMIVVAGLDPDRIAPPENGRAPGWNAGLVVAGREPPSSLAAPAR